MSILIKNIKELATAKGSKPLKGNQLENVEITNNICIAIENEIITFIGSEIDAPKCKKIIDASQNLVTPGLIDSHTHLVFGGWRQKELELKLKGHSYLDILKDGGGILSTVNSTREEKEKDLFEKGILIINEMLEHGTTTIESKSGYGLNLETELKQLEVARKLNKETKMDIVLTFLGAHAFPKEYKEDHKGFIKIICEEMIPKISKFKDVRYCDIFCETAVFNPKQTEEILNTAKKYGFKIKMHGDEIDYIGGGELAGKLNCISAEHLIQSSDKGIEKMSEAGTIGVLLPATSFYLNKPFARAKKMVEKNMAIAIATDFNPGSTPNLNLQFPMTLGCLRYGLTPKEVLSAVTLNPACVIEKADSIGTIEVGKKADIVIWNAPDLNYLFYRYGNNQVKTVIKNGEVVVSR